MGYHKNIIQSLEDAKDQKMKCPTCKTYTLRIYWEEYATCENGHSIEDMQVILKVLEEDDFNGYYDVDLTGMD